MKLGSLNAVELRKMWKNEAYDFTPWLAENLDEVAKSIGWELEFEDKEVSVGPYSADIVARDIATGKRVIIENQLEKTNHDHLGKVLTYAAILDATAVIWVSSRFVDEHKKTLDWLNDLTSDELSLFGIEIKLWQIDSSNPAVQFKVVSSPSEIKREIDNRINTSNLSETRLSQFEFWKKFRNKLIECGKIPSVQTARPQYWFNVSLGRSGVHISCIANTYDKKVGIRINISNRIADAVFPQLIDMKDEIEKEMGIKLEWNPNPDNVDKSLAVYHDGDISDSSQIDKILDWMLSTTIRCREVFSPRLKNMDFTVAPRDSDED